MAPPISFGTAIGAAGVGMQLFGGMYGKRAAKATAAARAQALEYNAKVDKRNEESALISSEFARLTDQINIRQFETDFEGFQAVVSQRISASGFRSGTGTPREVQIAAAGQADVEIQKLQTASAARVSKITQAAEDFNIQSVLNRNYAQIERQAGMMRGSQAVMSSLTSAGKSAYLLATS